MTIYQTINKYGELKNTIRLAEQKLAPMRKNLIKSLSIEPIKTNKYIARVSTRTIQRLDEEALRSKFGDDVIDQFLVTSRVNVLNVDKITR